MLAFYTKVTVYFPGVKQLSHGVYHPLPSSIEVKEKIELYIYFPSAPSCPVME
jgi:hypothetical protein